MVCVLSSTFQRRGLHYHETETSIFVETGIANSARQVIEQTESQAATANIF